MYGCNGHLSRTGDFSVGFTALMKCWNHLVRLLLGIHLLAYSTLMASRQLLVKTFASEYHHWWNEFSSSAHRCYLPFVILVFFCQNIKENATFLWYFPYGVCHLPDVVCVNPWCWELLLEVFCISWNNVLFNTFNIKLNTCFFTKQYWKVLSVWRNITNNKCLKVAMIQFT